MNRNLLSLIVTLLTCWAASARAAESPAEIAASVKEILRANCLECHSAEEARADVRVLNHAELLENEYVVPGKPDDSVIYRLITSTDEDSMPPQSRPSLTAEQIATVRKWIASGADAFPVDVVASAAAKAVPKVKKENTPSPSNVAEENTEVEDVVEQAEVLDVILQHVRKTENSDRPFLRYFSLRHLLAEGVTAQRMEDHHLALAKAINHLSRERDLEEQLGIDVQSNIDSGLAGEMIFRLPNGTQGYNVCDKRGNRIDQAPTSIVVDKFASDRVVKNGLGCIRCHRNGIKDFSDVVRDIVIGLPADPGFDKRKALQLYPDGEAWNKLIEDDQKTLCRSDGQVR